MATVMRFTRAGVLDAINSNYVAYQQAMGIPRRVVIWRYVLRNALIGTVTQIGLIFGNLLANGVVVEDADGATLVAAAAERGKIAISGKLPSGKKKGDYAEALEAAGYELVGSVTRDLSYLVLADPESTSAKAKKARSYNVKVISEDAMVELLGD